MAEKIRWGVSADSSGLLTGRPAMWQRLWGEAIASHKRGFVGVEIFPWLNVDYTRSMMADAAKLGLEISGIHGRTGGIHDAYSLFGRMIMTVLNKGMVDTCELITTLGRQVPKILVHAPEIRRKDVRRLLDRQPGLVNCIAIENHLHIGAAGTALDVALMLKRSGVNVELVFDLFHCWSAVDHLKVIRRWNEVRKQNEMLLNNVAAHDIKVSYHLPIGPGGDGLPLEFITQRSYGRFWRALAKDLERGEKDGLVGTRTIENQQVFWEAVGVFGQAVSRQVEWNKRVVTVLADCGVI